MAKKRSYQPVLIIVTILFLILASFLTYYFGFYKQTIFGVPSEVKVGDIIKFYATAQVGGRAGITCYAEPTLVIGNPDCQLCSRVSLGKKLLNDGCVGLPCNPYDQWSYTPTEAKNQMGLDVKYTCSGVTAPPNDKLTFSVKEATITSSDKKCIDSDLENPNIKGIVRYEIPIQYFSETREDSCYSSTAVNEWTCDSTNTPIIKKINCPIGSNCQNGACLATPPSGGTSGGTTGGSTGGGTQCTSPQYLSTATNTCKTCETGDKGTFCKDNKRYFITTSIALTTSGDKTCVDEERLFEVCSDDEICNKETGCVPDVKEGTTRNKKCVNNERYSSVNYEEFEGTTSGGQWRTVNEFCIGDQFCNPETLECELKEDAPKVKTNETEKEEKKTLEEFDFNEFFKTYGIAIGILAFLLVVGLIFIFATMKRKK